MITLGNKLVASAVGLLLVLLLIMAGQTAFLCLVVLDNSVRIVRIETDNFTRKDAAELRQEILKNRELSERSWKTLSERK